MRNVMKQRRIVVCSLLVALICSILGLFTMNTLSANATNDAITVEQVTTFTMQEGASVRLEEGHNGLRYFSSMSKDEYTKLKANSDYKQIVFGIVIAPADYMTTFGEFNKATLFGVDGNKVYDWAEWNGTEWVYNGDKTRIINIVSTSLNTQKVADKAIMSASITDLDENNIPRDFIARGYVKAVKADDSEVYALANYYDGNPSNNTRSMALVAERAVVDESADAPSSTDKTWLTDNYLNNSEIFVDNTANAFTVDDVTSGIDISAMGTVKHVTDGAGNEFDFEVEENKLIVDLDDKTADEAIFLTLYTLKDGSYKLNKIKVNFDHKTLITSEEEFLAMRSAKSGDYILANDITLTSALTIPEDNFGGSLDGNGYTIFGVQITSNTGLFKKVNLGAEVKNLHIKDATISGTNTQAGVICVEADPGTIFDNLYISASITSRYCAGIVKYALGDGVSKTNITNCVINITNKDMPTPSGTIVAFGGSTATLDLTDTYCTSATTTAKLVGDRGDSYATFRDTVNALDTEASPRIFTVAEFKTALDNKIVAVSNYELTIKALNFITISNLNDFNAMREATNKASYYILTKDIDFGGYTFAGTSIDSSITLDGCGFALKNFKIAKNGIFYTFRGTMKNIAFVDVELLDQGGTIAYNGPGAVIDKVYFSVKNIAKVGTAAIFRAGGSDTTTIKNCVVYVKEVVPTDTATNPYDDEKATGLSGVSMTAYSSTGNLVIEDCLFVSDVESLYPFRISGTGTTVTQSVNNANPVYSLNDFVEGIKGGDISVSDISLLNKIIETN